jgi:hypothetical protein
MRLYVKDGVVVYCSGDSSAIGFDLDIELTTVRSMFGEGVYKTYFPTQDERVLLMSDGLSVAIIDNKGDVIGIKHYSRVAIFSDKPQILADGTDTATITATVDDTTSTETIELYHGETLVDSKPAVNGVATFEITMTEPGTLTLTVKSTTKYGQDDVSIEGV